MKGREGMQTNENDKLIGPIQSVRVRVAALCVLRDIVGIVNVYPNISPHLFN